MKKALLGLFLLSLSPYLDAQISARLNIPPRIQWPNNNGYCGEMSIQSCGLYYGDYISEGLCRRVAGGEVLIYVNDTNALDSLSLTYNEWDPNPPSPQYKNYFDWVKQYLNNKYPVIITVYISGLSDPDYDHIIPAIGFYAKSVGAYTATDSLTYNTNFDTIPFSRVFSTLYGTRSVANSSAPFPYYVPQNVDYGVAVTGIADPGHVTRPVHIVLGIDSEPNVSIGMTPVMLKAQIIADSLTIGRSYALLRYNNYRTVPSTGFSPSKANSTVYFTATAVTKTVVDSFMSDTAVFYRCIPYSATGINEKIIVKSNNLVYPNPSSGNISIHVPEDCSEIEVYNINGKLILNDRVDGRNSFEINLPQEGEYVIRLNCVEKVYVNKVEVIR